MHRLLLLCLVLFSSAVFSSTVTKDIAYNPYWLKLGHYNQQRFSSYESEVDSNAFFFSPVGKSDPHAELIATIKAFELADNNEAQCRFPARYRWLKDHFFPQWPELLCPEIDVWQQLINPKGITLVFPTAFMNDPSSMFGHTLLRIDARDQTRSRELIAFAVNFAAEPDATDNAALYALKGVIGQYPGKFTLRPYYRRCVNIMISNRVIFGSIRLTYQSQKFSVSCFIYGRCSGLHLIIFLLMRIAHISY